MYANNIERNLQRAIERSDEATDGETERGVSDARVFPCVARNEVHHSRDMLHSTYRTYLSVHSAIYCTVRF